LIPEFNTDGNLPEGIYTADEKEFMDRFCVHSARRKWLGERLTELFALLKATGKAKRLFIWGSFISAKESPNDIDVLLIMADDFHLENMPEDCRDIFNYVRARLKFNMDIFWSKRSIGEDVIKLWLDTYQTTKDFKRRGIMEVILT